MLLVGVYLTLNCIVLCVGFYELATHPSTIPDWKNALVSGHGNPVAMIGAALIVFRSSHSGFQGSRLA